VTNMKIQFGEGLGFAIPVDAVKFFLKYRDAYAYDNDNPSNPFRYLQRRAGSERRRTTKPGARSCRNDLACVADAWREARKKLA